MSLLALLPVVICALQVEDPPILVVPEYFAEPHVAPGGEQVMLLGRDTAWLLAGAELEARLGLETGPRLAAGDRWEGVRFAEDGQQATLWSLRGVTARVDTAREQLLSRSTRRERFMEWEGFASPDGRLVGRIERRRGSGARAEAGLLFVEDVSAGDHALVFEGESFALGCFSTDGRWLFRTSAAGVERIDMRAPEERFPVAEGIWQTLAATRGTGLLLFNSDQMRSVDYETGETQRLVFEPALQARRLAGVDPAGQFALVAGGSDLRVLSLPTLELAWRVTGLHNPVLVPGAGAVWSYDLEQNIHVHELATGRLLWTAPRDRFFRGHLTPVYRRGDFLLPRPDGKLARFSRLTGSFSGLATVNRGRIVAAGLFDSGQAWSLTETGELCTFEAHSGTVLARHDLDLKALRATSKGEHLVAIGLAGQGQSGPASDSDPGNSAKTVGRIFAGPALKPRGTYEQGDHALLVGSGERLLTYGGSQAGLRFVRLADGSPLETIGAEFGPLQQVSASSDGSLLAALDAGRRPHLWNRGTHLPLSPAASPTSSLALDGPGQRLALGFRAADTAPPIRLYDARDGSHQRSLSVAGWFPFGGEVRQLLFARAGTSLLATTGDCGSVQAWSTADGKLSWMHDYGGGNPSSLSLSADPAEETLWVDGMTDATQLAFDLATGKVLADYRGTGLSHFVVGQTSVLARRGGSLVLLKPDGSTLLERVELGGGQAAVLRGAQLSGPPQALKRVFLRVSGTLIRGDDFVKRSAARDD